MFNGLRGGFQVSGPMFQVIQSQRVSDLKLEI